MPPTVDSISKRPNNRFNPIYPSAVLDQVKKIGVSFFESHFRPIVIITPSNSQRLEPPNTFPGAFPTPTPYQKQLLRKYLNNWKDRKIMQNHKEELAHEKFNLYLKRRAIYVWYGRLKEKQYQKKWNKKRKNLAKLPDDFKPHSILKKSDKPNKLKTRRKMFRFDQNDKIYFYHPESDDQTRYFEVIEGKNYVYDEIVRKEVKRVLGIGNFYEEKYLYKARTTKVWKMAFEQYREGKHADQQILKKLI